MSVIEISKNNGKNHYQTAVLLIKALNKGMLLVDNKEATIADLEQQIRTGVYR